MIQNRAKLKTSKLVYFEKGFASNLCIPYMKDSKCFGTRESTINKKALLDLHVDDLGSNPGTLDT